MLSMNDKIKLILSEVLEKPELQYIDDDTNLIDEVGIGSLEMINFLLKIEEEFSLEIDFDRLDISFLNSINAFNDVLSGENDVVIHNS